MQENHSPSKPGFRSIDLLGNEMRALYCESRMFRVVACELTATETPGAPQRGEAD
jgi:hypothetical protein